MAHTPLRNVAIVGASGHIGPFILSALVASPSRHNITVVTRESSQATFPPGTHVVRVGDDYPRAQMEGVFRGQDAVVLSLGFAGEHHHRSLVEAAIEAGVKRVVPSSYGCNDQNEAVQKIFPIAAAKAKMMGEMKELQQQAEKEGKDWSWTNICCGLFFDFCHYNNGRFFDYNSSARTAKLWDSGANVFSATTRPTIGLAVARVLALPAQTANRSVYLSSFETSQRDVLAAVQKATGTTPQDWAVENVDADEEIAKYTRQREEATEMGPRMMAIGRLALASNMKPEFGQNFKELGLLENEMLGIPKESMEDVVREVVQEQAKAS